MMVGVFFHSLAICVGMAYAVDYATRERYMATLVLAALTAANVVGLVTALSSCDRVLQAMRCLGGG